MLRFMGRLGSGSWSGVGGDGFGFVGVQVRGLGRSEELGGGVERVGGVWVEGLGWYWGDRRGWKVGVGALGSGCRVGGVGVRGGRLGSGGLS